MAHIHRRSPNKRAKFTYAFHYTNDINANLQQLYGHFMVWL